MEQSHVMNLLIAGADATVPLTAAASYITSYASLDDGAFSVVNDQNMVLDAGTDAHGVTTNDRACLYGIRLVGRYDTKLVYSDLIKVTDIITAVGSETAAAAEQVTYIGYTGSGNSISVINDNVYKLNIQFDTIGRTGRGNTSSLDIMYKSDAAATQTSVAFGLLGNLVPSLAKMTESPCVVRLINSAALVDNDRFTSWVAGVKGSKFLTFQTNMATTSGLTIAVGDLIRIGNASDDVTNPVALGSTVYKVVTIVSGTVLEIDRPFTSASGTATASTDCSLIPIATAGNYGIRINGVAPTWIIGKRPWNKNIFKVGLLDFGSTVVTESTRASLGVGLENQIKDLEYFCNGGDGNKYRGDYMYTSYTSRVPASATYKQICLTWASKSRSESIGGPGNNPKQLIIALHITAVDNDANDIIIDVLEAFTGVELLASY